MDPFAGGGDLLQWARRNHCSSTIAYDIEPKCADCIQRDSLMDPPDYQGAVLVTNPPYLAANKCRTGDKRPFEKWQASDYYKCHLASLNECDEAIEIVPSNFLCESRSAARERLFCTHHVVSAKIWDRPVFDDTNSGICVLHIKRGARPEQRFLATLFPKNETFEMVLKPEYGYLHGEEFFEHINVDPIRIIKTDIGMDPPNTKIVVGLLDHGAWPVGLSINDGEPLFSREKSFTTYQVTLPDHDIDYNSQRAVVAAFQEKMRYYREMYSDMFLANYMGPKQKILSRSYVHKMMTRCMMDAGLIADAKAPELFEW